MEVTENADLSVESLPLFDETPDDNTSVDAPESEPVPPITDPTATPIIDPLIDPLINPVFPMVPPNGVAPPTYGPPLWDNVPAPEGEDPIVLAERPSESPPVTAPEPR